MIRSALFMLTLVAGVSAQAATKKLSVHYGAVGVGAGQSIDLTNEFRVKYPKYDWESVKLVSLRVLASSADEESTVTLQMGQETTDPRGLTANAVSFYPSGFEDSTNWKLLFTGDTVLKGAEAVVEISAEPKRKPEPEVEKEYVEPRTKRGTKTEQETYDYDSSRYGYGYGYGRSGYGYGRYGYLSPYSALGLGSGYGYGRYYRGYGYGYGRGYGGYYRRGYGLGMRRRFYY